MAVGTQFEASVNLLISQWATKPRMRAFVGALIQAKCDGILAPLRAIENYDAIEQAEGYWLDTIGGLLGLQRPPIDSTGRTARFGFDGVGVGWDTARMGDHDALPVLAPAGDELYRRLLRARGRALLSLGELGSLIAAAREIDPTALVVDGQDMTVTIRTAHAVDMLLAYRIGALPVAAGIALRIIGLEQFGFDDAGVGWDAGPYGSA